MSFLNLKTYLSGRSPTSDPNLCQRASTSSNRKASTSSTSTTDSPHSSISSVPNRAPLSTRSAASAKAILRAKQKAEQAESDYYAKNPCVRSEEPVRVFIVDRRRAILEKIAEPCVWDYHYDYKPPADVKELKLFITDQYADNSLPSWAFRFNFEKWNKDYNVTQVIIQNLACFLDFEKTKMVLAPLTNNNDDPNKKGPPGTVLTPPWSGEEQGSGSGYNSPNGQQDSYSAYHHLPSSQDHQPIEQFTVLNEDNLETLRSLSGGRIERLANSLSGMPFTHLILRDHGCYQQRPTLMLLWFLRMLPENVVGLTLDDIQAETAIPLAEVIPWDRLNDINIKLADYRSGFFKEFDILMKWLSIPIEKKHRVRLFLSNFEIGIKHVLEFITEWRNTPDTHLFDNITIDAFTMDVNEFVKRVESPTNDWIAPEEWNYLGAPRPRPQSKQYVWKHKKSTAVIHYRFREGQFVFTCHKNSDEMLYRVLTDKQFDSVKRTAMMNLIAPRKLPFATKDMTVLANVIEPEHTLMEAVKGLFTRTSA